jgi:hypothetical protein
MRSVSGQIFSVAMETLSPVVTLRKSFTGLGNCDLSIVLLTPNKISEKTVHLELAMKGHVLEILSILQRDNMADNTAIVNVPECGAIAATQTENAVLVHPFAESACANLETVHYQV